MNTTTTTHSTYKGYRIVCDETQIFSSRPGKFVTNRNYRAYNHAGIDHFKGELSWVKKMIDQMGEKFIERA